MALKERIIMSALISSVVLGTGGVLIGKADGLDAGKTADSIFQAAQQEQVKQQTNAANSGNNSNVNRSSNNNITPSYQPSINRNNNGGTAIAGNTVNNSEKSPSNRSSYDNYYENESDDGSNDSGVSDAPSSSTSTSHNTGHDNDSSKGYRNSEANAKARAENKANAYLAKVREKLALKTAKNNDGGAWELRHSYENQLQVINNGTKTAQTRALQVQLSGELDQLQAVHDRHVDTFNQQIDALANDHSTDEQAVRLQDSIDYEDAQLAQKQEKVRKQFYKRIKAINPVHKKQAIREAKNEYHKQLKDKGLVDPYKLQKDNRDVWQAAQTKAQEMREDY